MPSKFYLSFCCNLWNGFSTTNCVKIAFVAFNSFYLIPSTLLHFAFSLSLIKMARTLAQFSSLPWLWVTSISANSSHVTISEVSWWLPHTLTVTNAGSQPRHRLGGSLPKVLTFLLPGPHKLSDNNTCYKVPTSMNAPPTRANIILAMVYAIFTIHFIQMKAVGTAKLRRAVV